MPLPRNGRHNKANERHDGVYYRGVLIAVPSQLQGEQRDNYIAGWKEQIDTDPDIQARIARREEHLEKVNARIKELADQREANLKGKPKPAIQIGQE